MIKTEPSLSTLWPLVKLEEWSLMVDHLTAARSEFLRKLAYAANSSEDLKRYQGLVKFCDELIDLKNSVNDALKRSSRENA